MSDPTSVPPPRAIWLGSCPSKCSRQASDSSFNISRKHSYTIWGAEGALWQREALPAGEGTAARSAAPSDRPPEILISSKSSNTDLQKQGIYDDSTMVCMVFGGPEGSLEHQNTEKNSEQLRHEEKNGQGVITC